MKKKLSKDEVGAIIQGSLIKKRPFQAWEIIFHSLLVSNLEIKAVRLERNELEFQSKSEADYQGLKKMIRGIGQLNFYLPHDNLVFLSELKKITESGRLVVSVPDKWMIEERRSQGRVETKGLAQVHLKTKRSILFLTVLDISTTGISIMMKTIDAKIYQVNDTLEGCRVDLLDQHFEVDLIVKRIKSFKHYEFENYPYEVSVIGMSFKDNQERLKSKILIGMNKLLSEIDRLVVE